MSRELRQGVVLLDPGDAARLHNLPGKAGRATVVIIGGGLGYHDGQIGLAVDGRGVHVLEDEAEILLQFLVPELRFQVGHVQLHLCVGGIAVGVLLGRIVFLLVF